MAAEPQDFLLISKYETVCKVAQEGINFLNQKNFEQATATGFVLKIPDDEKQKFSAEIIKNAMTLNAVIDDILLGLGVSNGGGK